MLSQSFSKTSKGFLSSDLNLDHKSTYKMSVDTVSTQDEEVNHLLPDVNVRKFSLIQPEENQIEEDSNDDQLNHLFDIYQNLQVEEKNQEVLFPLKDYIKNQRFITKNMRKTLIEYLLEVVRNWNYSLKSYFTCIYILDSFLSKTECHFDVLQLVGITSLFIAAKFHEITPYGIDAYVFVCDGACNKEDIKSFEQRILHSIDFQVLSPTSLCFYEFLSTFCCFNEEEYYYGENELVKCSTQYEILQFSQSVIAEAAVLIILESLGRTIDFPFKDDSKICMEIMMSQK